jgi:hypothetical protein
MINELLAKSTRVNSLKNIFGNVSDMLLKPQQPANQYNTKKTAPLFPFIHNRDKRFLSL